MERKYCTAWSAPIWGNAPVVPDESIWYPHVRLRQVGAGGLEADVISGTTWEAPGTCTLRERYSQVRIPLQELVIDDMPMGIEIEDPSRVEVHIAAGTRRFTIGAAALNAISRLNSRLGISWLYRQDDRAGETQIGCANTFPEQHQLTLVRGARFVTTEPLSDRDIVAAELRAALAYEYDHQWQPQSHAA